MEETNNNKKKIIIIVCIVIAVLLLIGGAILLKNKLTNKPAEPVVTQELIGDTTKEVVDSKGQGVNLQEEALALSLQYKDVIGWLLVPGTSIDAPIFQSTDNDRYLRKNRDNVYTGWGEPFLDYVCDINKVDNPYAHYIIYGHNTGKQEDICFNSLLNYKNEEFLKNHKYIEFSTINKNYKWEIFSVYVTNTDDFYIDVTFSDDADYTNFLSVRKSKSMFNTGVEVNKDDKILTLSTCDYTVNDGRFVVMAKLVKE